MCLACVFSLRKDGGLTAFNIARFVRHLAANGTLREVDVDTYTSTRLSSSLRQDSFKNAIGFM